MGSGVSCSHAIVCIAIYTLNNPLSRSNSDKIPLIQYVAPGVRNSFVSLPVADPAYSIRGANRHVYLCKFSIKSEKHVFQFLLLRTL